MQNCAHVYKLWSDLPVIPQSLTIYVGTIIFFSVTITTIINRLNSSKSCVIPPKEVIWAPWFHRRLPRQFQPPKPLLIIFGCACTGSNMQYMCKVADIYIIHALCPPNGRLSLQWVRTGSPENTKRWSNAVMMLGQRRRRWPNIIAALDKRLVFTDPGGRHPSWCWRTDRLWRGRGKVHQQTSHLLMDSRGKWYPVLGQCWASNAGARPKLTRRLGRFGSTLSYYQ